MKESIDKSGVPKIAIIGFPYDENSSYLKGASKAPPLIREALHADGWNYWSESGVDLGDQSILVDVGDVPISSGHDYPDKIEKAVLDILGQGLNPLSLGGDHAITYPIIRAFSKKYVNLTILHFDAHPDLYDDYHGNRYSHASPFARIMEEKLAKRLIQIGIRTIEQHQKEQADRFGVETIEMKDWTGSIDFPPDTMLYISFDMDVLDPAFAPGISHYEPGGASIRQVLAVIQQLRVPIVGADIVEYNPERDIHSITAMAAAKILKEIAGKMLE